MTITTESRTGHRCPLCQEMFAGMGAYTAHLGEVHNLYDDDDVEAGDGDTAAVDAVTEEANEWAEEAWPETPSEPEGEAPPAAPHEWAEPADVAAADRAEPRRVSSLPTVGPHADIADLWRSASEAPHRPAGAGAVPFLSIVSALLFVVSVLSLIGFDRWVEFHARVDANLAVQTRTADLNWAKAALLTPSEVGPGWTVDTESLEGTTITPDEEISTTGDAAIDAALNKCSNGGKPRGVGDLGVQVDRTLAKSDGTAISQEVDVFGDVAGAKRQTDDYVTNIDCYMGTLADLVAAEIGKEAGVTVQKGAPGPLDVPAVSDLDLGRTMPLTISGEGGSIVFRVDMVVARHARAISLVFVMHTNQDPGLLPWTAKTAAEKLLHSRPAAASLA